MTEMSRFSHMYLVGTALGVLTVIGAFMSVARVAPYVWAGIKKVPYDWLLSVLAFIGGLVTVGYGIGNMANAPHLCVATD